MGERDKKAEELDEEGKLRSKAKAFRLEKGLSTHLSTLSRG
jgi:hypothetical protein